MRLKVKLILLGLAGLVAVGVVVTNIVFAAEAEAPYIKINEKRLEAEHKEEVKIKNKSSIVLHGEIEKTKIEERCAKVSAPEAFWVGSKPKSDAKFKGNIVFEGCVLFAEEKEQSSCKDEKMTWKVKGQFWFEGKKGLGTKIVLLLEPESGAVFGTQEIVGEPCKYTGKYNWEGSVAVNVTPENKELASGELVFPKTPISHIWQEQEVNEEKQLELKFNKTTGSVQGEFATELATGSKFGAFNK